MPVRAAAQGHVPLDPRVAGALLPSTEQGRTGAVGQGLSPRETEVLRLVAQGRPEEAIRGEDGIFAIEDRHFIDAVMAKDARRIGTTYADGVKTLELILAAEESARTGQAVAL